MKTLGIHVKCLVIPVQRLITSGPEAGKHMIEYKKWITFDCDGWFFGVGNDVFYSNIIRNSDGNNYVRSKI